MELTQIVYNDVEIKYKKKSNFIPNIPMPKLNIIFNGKKNDGKQKNIKKWKFSIGNEIIPKDIKIEEIYYKISIKDFLEKEEYTINLENGQFFFIKKKNINITDENISINGKKIQPVVDLTTLDKYKQIKSNDMNNSYVVYFLLPLVTSDFLKTPYTTTKVKKTDINKILIEDHILRGLDDLLKQFEKNETIRKNNLIIQDYDELTSKASLEQSQKLNKKIFQQPGFGKHLTELCDGNKITDINEEMSNNGGFYNQYSNTISFKCEGKTDIHILDEISKYFVEKFRPPIKIDAGKRYRKKQKSKKAKKQKRKRTRKH